MGRERYVMRQLVSFLDKMWINFVNLHKLLIPFLFFTYCSSQDVFAPGDICAEWKVGNVWQVGYDASLVFIVDHKVSSWTIHLEFESPLQGLDCYIAKASSSDNIHWDIISFDWDGPQDEGDRLEIGFQVHFSGDPPDLIYADFDGPDHPICGSSEPTAPPTEPTTRPPTTQTTTKPPPPPTTTTSPPTTSTGPSIECPGRAQHQAAGRPTGELGICREW